MEGARVPHFYVTTQLKQEIILNRRLVTKILTWRYQFRPPEQVEVQQTQP